MNKDKRFILDHKNQIYFSLVAIIGTLGVHVGFITVDRYKTIINGTLGVTVLYLLSEKFLSPRKSNDEPTGIQKNFHEI